MAAAAAVGILVVVCAPRPARSTPRQQRRLPPVREPLRLPRGQNHPAASRCDEQDSQKKTSFNRFLLFLA